MDEAQVKQIAKEWSRRLIEAEIPHMVFGSVAMLLYECQGRRVDYKDIDFLVADDKSKHVINLLEKNGFRLEKKKNNNYEKNGVTIGIATPVTHPGLPSPTDKLASTDIDGVLVMTLDYLIASKKLAVCNLLDKIVNHGYRSHCQKSAVKNLLDACALCKKRDNDRAIQGHTN